MQPTQLLADGGVAGANVVSRTLGPTPESVKHAREFVKSALRRWGAPDLCGDAGLVVSELVTNALWHGLTPSGSPNGHDVCNAGVPTPPSVAPVFGDGVAGVHADGPIQVRMLREGSLVTCAVVDASSQAPTQKEPDFVAETGRGLHLVSSFSSGWGWSPLEGGGKVVWALFSTST